MSRPPRFSGFDEQIRRPLQQSDPRSYRRVLSALETLPPDHAAPLSMLITRMVGKKFSPETAQAHWQHILALKERMQQRLDFTVDIQAAAIQHFAMLQPGEADAQSAPGAAAAFTTARGLFAARHALPDSPDYWLARLKDEIQRSRRYSHSLSAVLVDAGALAHRPRPRQEQDLALLGKVLQDTVRTVDILTPCAPLRFLAILPDTNLREARELAARIFANTQRRTARAHRDDAGLALRLGAAQWKEGLSAAAFAACLEQSLREHAAHEVISS